VAEGGDPCVETESVDENLLDILWLDGFEVAVERAFGDDDDGLALPDGSVL
jgi:hypothetical protein